MQLHTVMRRKILLYFSFDQHFRKFCVNSRYANIAVNLVLNMVSKGNESNFELINALIIEFRIKKILNIYI